MDKQHSGWLRRRVAAGMVMLLAFAGAAFLCSGKLQAETIITPQLSGLVLQNVTADGTVTIAADGLSFVLTGGNTGSGLSGETDFTGISTSTGLLSFDWSYNSADQPGFDAAGYFLGSSMIQLANSDGQSGSVSISVTSGERYGWWVATADNTGEPGVLSVSFSPGQPVQTPEPACVFLATIGCGLLIIFHGKSRRSAALLAAAVISTGAAEAQAQSNYVPVAVTGQLTLVRVVNPSQIAAAQISGSASAASIRSLIAEDVLLRRRGAAELMRLPFGMHQLRLFGDALAGAVMPIAADLPVIAGGATFGFQGLSHLDQRSADSGNQLTIEPPNPSIAVGGGFIVEGVNNAVRVYDQSGMPLLPVLSSNQWFGLPPALDRSTNTFGPYPTDMRVYFDQDINRWFVMQRAQDVDSSGAALEQSHLYLAVSATADPTGAWNIYVMDTTDSTTQGCPCLADYPTIASDQYGVYISANEYDTVFLEPIDAIILAISKSQLGAAAASPNTYQFNIPRATGFEFAIHPATTPPGASKFVAAGGVEFFVSTQAFSAEDSQVALWAMTNTASLSASSASLLLTETLIPTENYAYPGVASQRSGPIPYGASLDPPGRLEFLDGNPDSRVQSLSYAGGRLFLTLPTQKTDSAGNSVIGGAWMILSPTYRSGVLAGNVLNQGYLSVTNNSILRPAVAVNASGQGAIFFTLVGPDYYPSAAWTTIDVNSPPGAIQIAAAGTAPEDGFTGYLPSPTTPVARWGDYSTARAAADGSIWMVTEYIPGGLRSTGANWGTYIARYVP
jgi:hypothetical protein